jgi:hypothetical protein
MKTGGTATTAAENAGARTEMPPQKIMEPPPKLVELLQGKNAISIAFDMALLSSSCLSTPNQIKQYAQPQAEQCAHSFATHV